MRARDDNAYPYIFSVTPRALLIALLFFCFLNGVIFFMYRNSIAPPVPSERLQNPVSFSEIEDKLELLRHETRKSVVFVGASAMWGAGSEVEAGDTYPALIAERNTSTAFYNFSFPAARPLDILLIAVLASPYASTTVVDVNEVHLGSAYNDARFSDRTSYIRTATLLKAYGGMLFSKVPEAEECLRRFGVPNKREFFVDMRRFIPMLMYKDAVQKDIFGMPYMMRAGSFVAKAFSLFSHSAPEVQTETTSSTSAFVYFQSEELRETLNSCIVSAHVSFASRERAKKRMVFILPPHARESWISADDKNHEWFSSMLSAVEYYDLDHGHSLPLEAFADFGHLRLSGQEYMAEKVGNILFVK